MFVRGWFNLQKKLIILSLVLFLLGWFSSSVYTNVISVEAVEYDNIKDYSSSIDLLSEKQKSKNNQLLEEFSKIEDSFSNKNKDKISPYDWIKTDDILVYDNYVLIKIKDPEWAIFTDTNSMDPVLDSTSNAIEIIPGSEKDVHLGDIVAYKSRYHEGTITHRVVEIGEDSAGWYIRLKGDNNPDIDPGKVRFNQVERIVVGILY